MESIILSMIISHHFYLSVQLNKIPQRRVLIEIRFKNQAVDNLKLNNIFICLTNLNNYIIKYNLMNLHFIESICGVTKV